jgi:hypothetical protein
MLCTVQQVASNSPQCSIQASDIKCGSLLFKAEISSEVTPLTMFKFLLALDQVIPYLKQVVKTELINYGATVGNVQIEVTENQAVFASDSSCATHNCQNGGICREMDNNYYCDCANTGFKGELCTKVEDAKNCQTFNSDVSKCDVCNAGFDLVDAKCLVCQSGFFMELDLATSVYNCIDITTNCDKYYHKSSVLVAGQCTDPCQPEAVVSILNKYAELVSASEISSDLVFAGQTGDLPAELFSGASCDIDACATLSCGNGICVSQGIDNIFCQCANGYAIPSGEVACTENIDECLVDGICGVGGTCSNVQLLNSIVSGQSNGNGYECACDAEYSADSDGACTVVYNDCLSDGVDAGLCGDFGTCVDSVRTVFNTPAYTCTCNDGYVSSGGVCADFDECAVTPCMNSAQCHNLVNDYQCGTLDSSSGTDVYSCPSGWEGQSCNIDIDECATGTPCGDNGDCANSDGGFTCTCTNSYMGTLCDQEPIIEIPVPVVLSSQIGSLLDTTIVASCPTGASNEITSASTATTDIDFWSQEMPKWEALAKSMIVDAKPAAAVYFARYDQISIDCGTSTRKKRSTEENSSYLPKSLDWLSNILGFQSPTSRSSASVVYYTATVNVVYKVKSSEKDTLTSILSASTDSSAVSGVSRKKRDIGDTTDLNDAMLAFITELLTTVISDACTTDCDALLASAVSAVTITIAAQADLCESDPCDTTGTDFCTNDEASNYETRTCTCLSGYSGDACATDIDECSGTADTAGVSTPCNSAGTCNDAIDSYHCTCSLTSGGTPYTGTDCETDWFCDSGLCRNGASCSDGTCTCTVTTELGYEGTQCEAENYCLGTDNVSKCQNGGTCVSASSAATCICATGFYGDSCENEEVVGSGADSDVVVRRKRQLNDEEVLIVLN